MASDPVLSRPQLIEFCESEANGSAELQFFKREAVFRAIGQALQEDWQTAALLNDRTRAAMRDRRQAGESIADLAKDYGVPEAFVEALCAWQLGADAALVHQFWGTLRQGWTMPCLWGSEADARANCDPDERVALFAVQEVAARVREGA